MKPLFVIIALLCAGAGWSAEESAPGTAAVLEGEVLEVMNVDSYTYLRLKTATGEIWAAVGTAPLHQGATVAIENAVVMHDFESRTLKRTFPQIVFGTLGGAAANDVAAAHAGLAETADTGAAAVPKASGADARTVAEVVGQSDKLKDKPVLLRGRVVKYTAAVMNRNWIHLRDGSGSAADGTNDILVTTEDQARVGDIVLVKGIVRTDKDFGAGYAYKVLIEEAGLQK